MIHCKYDKLEEIEFLEPHPRNTNNHPEKQIKLLGKIINHTGWRHPIIVSKKSGYIVAGHGRLEAARLNGIEKVPVSYQDFANEAEEFQFLIADNKIAELSNHDDNMMIDNIKDLDLNDSEFELLGLSDFSLDIKEPEVKNTGAELDLDSFDNFEHTCPKCGFEWNGDGSDNS